MTAKPIKKRAAQLSAMDIAKITMRKARKKERDIKLSVRKYSLPELSVRKFSLPEPPAGTSTARKLQNPDHIDIVKGMMQVPSARDMGLSEEGEEMHDKMVIAATRQLSATTGGQYSRYIARRIEGYSRPDTESMVFKMHRRFRTRVISLTS